MDPNTRDKSIMSDIQNHYPFYSQLSIKEKEILNTHTVVTKYDKGAHIHQGDSDCIGMLLVKSGSLRTYMLSEDGREITLYRIYEGEMCVLSASCVLNSIDFEVFMDAEEDSEIVLLSAPALASLMANNIYVECFVYKVTADRFSDVMWAMQQILFMSFDKRLAVFLYEEQRKNNSDLINLTHEQVAKYMGSAREVVSRMLKYFVSEDIVELFRGGIRIKDKEKLRSLI